MQQCNIRARVVESAAHKTDTIYIFAGAKVSARQDEEIGRDRRRLARACGYNCANVLHEYTERYDHYDDDYDNCDDCDYDNDDDDEDEDEDEDDDDDDDEHDGPTGKPGSRYPVGR